MTEPVLIQQFNFTGAEETINLPAGTYLIKLWGGEGWRGTYDNPAGRGGYAEGKIELTEATTVYVYVGEGGKRVKEGAGWPDGGQGGGLSAYGGAGGGSSSIRIGGNTNYDRVLVAGAGGGSNINSNRSAYGGGLTGGNAADSNATGGTQTAGGTGGTAGVFGAGANAGIRRSAGGGGWFGGGSSDTSYNGGGGGSSYIGGTVTVESVNFPIIPIIDGYTEADVNEGNGIIEIYSVGGSAPTPTRKLAQFI